MDFLACGSYGQVFRSEENGEAVAVKMMKRNETTEREAEIAKIFSRYDHFVPVLKCEYSEESISLTMPLFRRTLLDLIRIRSAKKEKRGLSVGRTFRVFQQLVSAVKQMHNMGYVHKDLKLENMLYSKGRVYVCDFGFSRSFTKGQKALCDNLGSLHYAAPELWLRTPYEGPEVDIWALGVCLYVLSTGFFPFGGRTPADIFSKIESETAGGRLRFPEGTCRSSRLRDLIRKLLVFEAHKRITLAEIEAHPFFVAGVRTVRMPADNLLGQSLSLESVPSLPQLLPTLLPRATTDPLLDLPPPLLPPCPSSSSSSAVSSSASSFLTSPLSCPFFSPPSSSCSSSSSSSLSLPSTTIPSPHFIYPHASLLNSSSPDSSCSSSSFSSFSSSPSIFAALPTSILLPSSLSSTSSLSSSLSSSASSLHPSSSLPPSSLLLPPSSSVAPPPVANLPPSASFPPISPPRLITASSSLIAPSSSLMGSASSFIAPSSSLIAGSSFASSPPSSLVPSPPSFMSSPPAFMSSPTVLMPSPSALTASSPSAISSAFVAPDSPFRSPSSPSPPSNSSGLEDNSDETQSEHCQPLPLVKRATLLQKIGSRISKRRRS